MRILIAVLGAALVLNIPAMFGAAAQAQAVSEPRERVIIRAPAPYWDYNIVPRYRYRPEDDRVDPCGGPIVPVIRTGPQEQTVPLWLANAMGYGRSHGRDWPCRGRNR